MIETNKENVQAIVDFLNDMMFVDPKTMNAMMKTRFSCNRALADSDLVMVKVSDEDTPEYTVSFRGMISAIGAILGDRIASTHDSDTQQLLGFRAVSKTTEDIQVLSQDQSAYVLLGSERLQNQCPPHL